MFQTKVGKIGVYVCSDRHSPKGARALGLAGAEIVFNPPATVAGLSENLWELEQPAHAMANGYVAGSINRVGQSSEPFGSSEESEDPNGTNDPTSYPSVESTIAKWFWRST